MTVTTINKHLLYAILVGFLILLLFYRCTDEPIDKRILNAYQRGYNEGLVNGILNYNTNWNYIFNHADHDYIRFFRYHNIPDSIALKYKNDWVER